MATITISLPDSLKSFVESQIEAKGYGNVSEYFRSLLRDAQEKENEARLEVLLLEGLASGNGNVPDAAFWSDLKSEAAQLLAARPRKSGAR
ncbi:type II toxin-antitoxin system ParD family antitoxin [Shinella sp. PSBB067]|uniref:type II toxin-antitoxin system ParD family antitoxin n=1 Tax=unclassified Shinella TaxID=2643062 RepID=UPI00092AEDF4|nr:MULTISPECIES: type II toxin-antitoxin system ParD family antitoxin [unclassified Shinella]MBN9055078.1 type II toxin-antitoxin system ParD family antitoxin [Hyphomicrobiales bacterium]OJU85041.1 MAG: transcriptional regulator [Shinella sp. 65-6]QRI65712.1 type II toxin-antitoxin system ParD family antitoxin [Shinella sp. PSBB067]